AAAAKAPLAFDAHQCPRTITHSLVVPGPAQKIIPAQLKPATTAIAAGIRPGHLQPFAGHRAADSACASVGVADEPGNRRSVLRKYHFRVPKPVAARPP